MKSIFEKFSNANLVPTTSGTRGSSEVRAELKLERQTNKFALNRMATKLMGAQTGDFVQIICDSKATDINDAFYIAVSKNEIGSKISNRGKKSAGIGLYQNFNNSGIWSIMAQKNPAAQQLTETALAELNILVNTPTMVKDGVQNYAFLLKDKTSFEVVLVTDDDGNPLENVTIGKETFDRIYALTNMEVTPFNDSDNCEEEEEEEVVEPKSIFSSYN